MVRFSDAEEHSAEREIAARLSGQMLRAGRERWETNMKKIILAIGLIAASHRRRANSPDAIKAGDVDFTATLRSREYVWDWFQPTGRYQNQYAYSGNLLRLNFAEKRGALDLDAEIAVPFCSVCPNDATAPAPQGALGLGSNYFTRERQLSTRRWRSPNSSTRATISATRNRRACRRGGSSSTTARNWRQRTRRWRR